MPPLQSRRVSAAPAAARVESPGWVALAACRCRPCLSAATPACRRPGRGACPITEQELLDGEWINSVSAKALEDSCVAEFKIVDEWEVCVERSGKGREREWRVVAEGESARCGWGGGGQSRA